MSKQDRQGVRTAAELERKYEFGAINVQGKKIGGQDVKISQLIQTLTQLSAGINLEIAGMKTIIANMEATIEKQRNEWQKAYPIGSIYVTVDEMEPSELLGFGTWEQIKDTFLLAAGDNYNGGDIGGEAEHTLTLEEIPAHTHKFAYGVEDGAMANTMLVLPGENFESKSNKWAVTMQDFITKAGGDKAHNNMPPYLAVYVWKRTA